MPVTITNYSPVALFSQSCVGSDARELRPCSCEKDYPGPEPHIHSGAYCAHDAGIGEAVCGVDKLEAVGRAETREEFAAMIKDKRIVDAIKTSVSIVATVRDTSACLCFAATPAACTCFFPQYWTWWYATTKQVTRTPPLVAPK